MNSMLDIHHISKYSYTSVYPCTDGASCVSLHNREIRSMSRGIVLAEVLISIAIIAFVIVPLTVFVIHKQDIRSYMYHIWNLHEYVTYGLRTDPLLRSSVAPSLLQDALSHVADMSSGTLPEMFSETSIETEYASKNTCSALFSRVESELLRAHPDIHTKNVATQVEMTANVFRQRMRQSSVNVLDHPRNIPTALEVRRSKSVQGSNITMLYIGANSASTTDTDLYAVIDRGRGFASASTAISDIQSASDTASTSHATGSATDAHMSASSTSRFQIINAYEFGPGVVDMDTSGSRMVIAERSVVTPLRMFNIQDTSLSQTGYVTGDQIRYAYPKTIEVDTNHIYVGTEKHQSAELYVLRMPPFTSVTIASATPALFPELIPKASVISEIEINAGLNDIDLSDTYVMVATPLNPEFMFFDRQNVTGRCTPSRTGADTSPNLGVEVGAMQGADIGEDATTGSDICAPYIVDTALTSASNSNINHVSTTNINQALTTNQVGNLAPTQIYQPVLHIDAPGSSGNGKSIYNEQDMVILGRTVGNAELLVTKLQFMRMHELRSRLMHIFEQGIETAINRVRNMMRTKVHTEELINPNQSITHVIAPLHGAYIVAFTNQPQASVLIYKKIIPPSAHAPSTLLFASRESHMSQFGYRSVFGPDTSQYEKILTLETPFPIADIDCTSTTLYMLLQSTEATLSLWEL
jgi:hypothetical protein